MGRGTQAGDSLRTKQRRGTPPSALRPQGPETRRGIVACPARSAGVHAGPGPQAWPLRGCPHTEHCRGCRVGTAGGIPYLGTLPVLLPWDSPETFFADAKPERWPKWILV